MTIKKGETVVFKAGKNKELYYVVDVVENICVLSSSIRSVIKVDINQLRLAEDEEHLIGFRL